MEVKDVIEKSRTAAIEARLRRETGKMVVNEVDARKELTALRSVFGWGRQDDAGEQPHDDKTASSRDKEDVPKGQTTLEDLLDLFSSDEEGSQENMGQATTPLVPLFFRQQVIPPVSRPAPAPSRNPFKARKSIENQSEPTRTKPTSIVGVFKRSYEESFTTAEFKPNDPSTWGRPVKRQTEVVETIVPQYVAPPKGVINRSRL